MIRLALFIIPFMVLADVYGQHDFAIVGEDGAIDEIRIIQGVPLQLRTNFELVKGENVIIVANDGVVGPFQIGFSFDYYEDIYTEFFIGANGYVTFEPAPWAPVRESITIPSFDSQKLTNCILGPLKPWEYQNDTSQRYVTINRIAELSNNKLIVTWCNIPPQQSGEPTNELGTFQIILHASDKTIENHLINIPFANYFGNRATLGIMNKGADRATFIDGRNNASWVANNESWIYSWKDNDYEVKQEDYNPFPVVENLDWYRLDANGNRTWISSELQIVVSPNIDTRYQAETTSCWGEVIATAELSVIVEGVFPNAFNPRSSVPANRTFKMPVIPDAVVANYLLQVYNRWGQLVFETPDVNTGWNGRMQNTGQDCPAGVYHWIILVEENGKTPVTNSGAVMLLR